ncbi:unnamed protein product [Choristocarpus tenellus]
MPVLSALVITKIISHLSFQVKLEHNHEPPVSHDEDCLSLESLEARANEIRVWTAQVLPLSEMFIKLERDSKKLGKNGKNKVRNMVNKFRGELFSYAKDTKYFIQTLEKLPNLTLEYTKDEENQLQSAFWATPEQKDLAFRCGSVVMQETLLTSNRYELPLCLFLGLDEENQLHILCQALLQDKSTTSYMFAISNLVKVCGGRQPQVMFTVMNEEVSDAMLKVCPEARQMYCLQHAERRIREECSCSMMTTAFDDMMQLFRASAFAATEKGFSRNWEALLRFLQDTDAKEYMADVIFEKRKRWAFCYRPEVLTLGMAATQRLQQVFSVISGHLDKTCSLKQLLEALASISADTEFSLPRAMRRQALEREHLLQHNPDLRFKYVFDVLKNVGASQYCTNEVRSEILASGAYKAVTMKRIGGQEIVGGGGGLNKLDEPGQIRLSEAPDGLELDELDMPQGQIAVDNSRYTRTSLKNFTDLIWHSKISEVVRVSHKVTQSGQSHIIALGSDGILRASPTEAQSGEGHIVVLGDNGFHLCSCLQLVRIGMPCRHFFAAVPMLSKGSEVEFNGLCIHPQWRQSSGSWTAAFMSVYGCHTPVGDMIPACNTAVLGKKRAGVAVGEGNGSASGKGIEGKRARAVRV